MVEERAMTEREAILGRIREALTVTAPMPGGHQGNGNTAPPVTPPSAHASEWLPAVGASFEDQLAAFRTNATNLKADFHFVNGPDELSKLLLEIRDRESWKKIAAHAGELTDAACKVLALPVCKTDGGYAVNELETCDAGISECDALIAQTGSVLVTSRSSGGRALSVLPPHHVVLARRGQLLRDLPSAFAFLKKTYGSNYPSMISFITGPSRTGDIERILVLGAHGPKKLTIILL
jgi:L-lactate dehydrogenase complex protein LldG